MANSNIVVRGTTLEQPPSLPLAGGFDPVLPVPAAAPGSPLANNASIDVQFHFGVQKNGNYRAIICAIDTCPRPTLLVQSSSRTCVTACPAGDCRSPVRGPGGQSAVLEALRQRMSRPGRIRQANAAKRVWP